MGEPIEIAIGIAIEIEKYGNTNVPDPEKTVLKVTTAYVIGIELLKAKG